MPFMSFATRACQRPRMLKKAIKSILAQTDRDFEQVIMVDFERTGVPTANKMFGKYAHHMRGDYVYILDDDCKLIEPRFIQRAKLFVSENNYPTIVMVRSIRPQFKPHQMPHESVWGKEDKLRVTTTNALCYFVKTGVWKEHAHHFGSKAGGDWRLLQSMRHFDFAWLDLVVGETQQLGRGIKFESVTGKQWFDNIINGYGLLKLDDFVYRLDPDRVAKQGLARRVVRQAEKEPEPKEEEPVKLVYLPREEKRPPPTNHALLSRLNRGK